MNVVVDLVEEPTADSPAQIRASVTYTGDEQRKLSFGFTLPLSKYVAEQRTGGRPGVQGRLVVIPLEHGQYPVPDEPTDGCWRAIDWPERLDTGIILICDPGRVVDREYAVLAEPDGPCFPEGTYELRDEFRIGESSDVSIGWMVRLNVEY